jgi:peptidoglycan/LPS O-acetylase OafA/YrhL
MQKQLHLKGINGLRAIAALSVVVFHLNFSFKEFYHLPNLRTVDLAGFGVTIFFAISGFLITYLLLEEKKRLYINIKKFYTRRVLRIWPLYYLFLAISLLTAFIFNVGKIESSALFYYVFMAANIPFIFSFALPFLGHYWSIGVEEQFYLLWPWVIKRSENVLRTLISIAIGLILLRLLFRYIEYKWGFSVPYAIIHINRFDCMVIGAIGGYLAYNKPYLIERLSQPIYQIVSWLIIILLFFNKFHIASVIDHEIVSFATVILIINGSFNPKPLINLENSVLDFLGRISYGIYIIHQLVIFYTAQLLNRFSFTAFEKYLVSFVLVISITILLSYLSYEYFEKYFLKLKSRYAVVETSDVKIK